MTFSEAIQTKDWFQYSTFLHDTATEKGICWWGCMFERDTNLWADDLKKKFRDYIKTAEQREIYEIWVDNLIDEQMFEKEVNDFIPTLKQL